MIESIPNVNTYPLTYLFEHLKMKHKPGTLWMEFGVASGRTINYISGFTEETVYGFDSFEGLPETWREGMEQGAFTQHGIMPRVNNNVELIKGWFNETLEGFMEKHKDKKISFLHMDADLYSSTKYILDTVWPYLDTDCIMVFDELVNYPGFDGGKGELKAFYEFVNHHKVEYTWIGMNGTPTGMAGYVHENVAVRIKRVYPPKVERSE